MKLYKAVVVGMMMIAMVSVGGCCGGGSTVKSQTTTTTLGDELKALKDAYDKGIITEKQYEESKAQLIEQRTGQK